MNRLLKPRFLNVFLGVLIVSLLPIAGAGAAPPVGPGVPPTLPESVKDVVTRARLIQTNGNKTFILHPVLVEAIEGNENSIQLTYEVGIPKEYLDEQVKDSRSSISFDLFPFTAYAGSDSHSGCDSTVSVCATVVLNYTLSGDHGWYQNTTTRWTRNDSTVAWSNAKLGAYCYALWYPPRTGTCSQQLFKTIGVPTSGTIYTFTPTFAGSSNQMYLGAQGSIAGDQRVTLTRGVSTWLFTFCVGYGLGGFGEGCY